MSILRLNLPRFNSIFGAVTDVLKALDFGGFTERERTELWYLNDLMCSLSPKVHPPTNLKLRDGQRLLWKSGADAAMEILRLRIKRLERAQKNHLYRLVRDGSDTFSGVDLHDDNDFYLMLDQYFDSLERKSGMSAFVDPASLALWDEVRRRLDRKPA